MKLQYPLAALAAAFFVAGCDQSKQAGGTGPEPSADINIPPAVVQREVVLNEVKEAAEAAKTLLTSPRDQFVASMQQKLTDMDQKINELGDSIVVLNENTYANEAINSLWEQRFQLDPLFEELTKSSVEAWDDAKLAFESAFAELEKAYQDAKENYGS